MPAPDLFSVPRRFDLFTLLVATAACAAAFGFLRFFNASPALLMVAGGLFATVAAGQALGGDRVGPRGASILGATLFWAVFMAYWFFVEIPPRGSWPGMGFFLAATVAAYGVVTGYLAGVLVAGVFLVSFYLRAYFAGVGEPQESALVHEEISPWDQPEEAPPWSEPAPPSGPPRAGGGA